MPDPSTVTSTSEDYSPLEGSWKDFLPSDYDDATLLDAFMVNCDHQFEFYNDEEHRNQ